MPGICPHADNAHIAATDYVGTLRMLAPISDIEAATLASDLPVYL